MTVQYKNLRLLRSISDDPQNMVSEFLVDVYYTGMSSLFKRPINNCEVVYDNNSKEIFSYKNMKSTVHFENFMEALRKTILTSPPYDAKKTFPVKLFKVDGSFFDTKAFSTIVVLDRNLPNGYQVTVLPTECFEDHGMGEINIDFSLSTVECEYDIIEDDSMYLTPQEFLNKLQDEYPDLKNKTTLTRKCFKEVNNVKMTISVAADGGIGWLFVE